MIQLICHLWGDYILQTTWMATNKEKSWLAASAHAVVYTLPFLAAACAGYLSLGLVPLAVLTGSHLVIDRFGIAKKLRKFPDFLPESLRVWLPIVVDNTIHLTINWACIEYSSGLFNWELLPDILTGTRLPC